MNTFYKNNQEFLSAGSTFHALSQPLSVLNLFIIASIRSTAAPVSTGADFFLFRKKAKGFILTKAAIFLFIFSMATSAISAQTLPRIQEPIFKKTIFNIIQYGAKADGYSLATKNIQSAIDDCSKKGGGIVLVPNGFWITGPLVIRSNVNFRIAKNAILQFTSDKDQYPLVEGNWEGVPQMRNQSPLSADKAVNIGITGEGIIDGGGGAWRAVKKDKLSETEWKKLLASGGILSEDKKTWMPSENYARGNALKNPGQVSPEKTKEFYASVKDFLRPNLLVFSGCKKILLEGVTFQNSPAWCLHPLMCEDLTVRNVYAKNPSFAQNGDGIDVESCKNVLIEHSTFDVGDDGICIKSGRDEEGRKRGLPTENMIVRNCTVYHAHGGFVIGSEMSGGARNLFVSDCSFIGTDIGLRFKTTRGRGGIVEKIYVKNIVMKDIVGQAILFDMYYAAVDPVPLAGEKRELPKVELKAVDITTPQFKDFFIKDIVCNGADKAIFIRGLPEMHIKNINLENITITADKGIDMQEATGINLKNIHLITTDTNPVVDIVNSEQVVIDHLDYVPSAALLFRVNGDRSNTIRITNTDASKAKQKIEYAFGAKENMVSIH